MSKLLIATGADHGGYKMKKELIKHLKKNKDGKPNLIYTIKIKKTFILIKKMKL